MRMAIAAGLLAWACAGPALAEFRYDRDRLAVVANASVSLSGAVIDDPAAPGKATTDGNIDGYGSASLEWTADSGLILGAFVSGDTADSRPDTLKNNRAFLHLSGTAGRLEAGETSGPARRMSFYAPVLGSGQVRGDFARYAGDSALLWPYDTRQSLKLAYFSPPLRGLRVGASWAPRVSRFSVVHRNAVELGAQYEAPVGRWVLGASAAYDFGAADRPGLADIKSYSLGLQARRGRIVLGGSYVDRGDSGRFRAGLDQHEVNAGLAWRDARWAVAASAARTESTGFTSSLLAVGGVRSITDHLALTADLVGIWQDGSVGRDRGGAVLVVGVDVSL